MICNTTLYLDSNSVLHSARARFLTGNSDLLTDMSAFHECLSMRDAKKPQNTIKSFCEEVRQFLRMIRRITKDGTEFYIFDHS